MQDWLHGKLASYSIRILHKVYNIVYYVYYVLNKKSGRNDSPKLAETTQGRIDSGRNDPGRNDPRPKRLMAETTHGRNDPLPRILPHQTP